MNISVELVGANASQLAPGQAVLLAPGRVWGWERTTLAVTGSELSVADTALRMGAYLGPQHGEPLFQIASVLLAPLASDPEGPAWRCPVLKVLRDSKTGELEGPSPCRIFRQGVSLAWVTLSDKGAAGLRQDTAGPTIEVSCRDSFPVSLARGCVLPDDPATLRARLARLAHVDRFDLIVTTGGTGLAPRDTTPETTLTCIDQRLPGFEQAMMAASLAKTPKAVISRAVAGTMGGSIVINLPGSPKAVAENLQAVLPAIEHALDKLLGDPSDCAA